MRPYRECETKEEGQAVMRDGSGSVITHRLTDWIFPEDLDYGIEPQATGVKAGHDKQEGS